MVWKSCRSSHWELEALQDIALEHVTACNIVFMNATRLTKMPKTEKRIDKMLVKKIANQRHKMDCFTEYVEAVVCRYVSAKQAIVD